MLGRVETRYSAKVEHLRSAVLEAPGRLPPEERQACARNEPPEQLAGYVEKVANRAFEVTDNDVAALREQGYSEDEIFEATVSTALGAGLSRLERGLAALEGRIS
jgi:alkylhydroperoxidase family enzyme